MDSAVKSEFFARRRGDISSAKKGVIDAKMCIALSAECIKRAANHLSRTDSRAIRIPSLPSANSGISQNEINFLRDEERKKKKNAVAERKKDPLHNIIIPLN